MARVRLYVKQEKFDKEFIGVCDCVYSYIPINAMLNCLSKLGIVNAKLKCLVNKFDYADCYRITIKSKCKKKELKEQVLKFFSENEKIKKGFTILEIK